MNKTAGLSSLLLSSLLSSALLVACEDEPEEERQLPCEVTNTGTIPEGVNEERFVAYFIDEVAGGLICMPGDPVELRTCRAIFLDCIAAIEGPVGETTTFTIGIENRSFRGDILVGGPRFGEGTDPSFSVPGVASGIVAPGTSLEITVAFAPSVEGEVSGTLAILSNASNVESGGNDTIIQLRGTGFVP